MLHNCADQPVENLVWFPGTTKRLMPHGRPASHAGAIVELLRLLPQVQMLFEALTPELEQKVNATLEWLPLASGESLFSQGDQPLDVFILTSGRLGVFTSNGQQSRLVDTVGEGQLVCDATFPSNTGRMTTIVALEDSMLVRLPRSTIELLAESAPAAARLLVRLLGPRRALKPVATESAPGIAIVSLSESNRTRVTLDRLQNVEAICLRSPEQEAQWRLTGPVSTRSVLYVADDHRSAWARHCVSQSTHVVFIADAGDDAMIHDAIAFANNLRCNARLILVHHANTTAPANAPAWLRHFSATQILHVRSGHQEDLERALRLVSHQAMCVVFSGGGARALAHVGALLAFEEKGLAIDAAGGTSMGALIAGLVAQGRKANEILEGMRRHLVDSNPIRDYTFPFVSLARGRKLARIFSEVFEDTKIENLWKPFFCVSVDLTSRSMVVHRSGSLSVALRASTAIPGILPPVTDDGRVLVDGCVMDSLPTTVMRSMHRGLVVGIDVSSSFAITAADVASDNKSWFSLLRHRSRGLPPLARILMSSAVIGSSAQLSASRAAADVLIEPKLDGINLLSFKAFDKAVEAGYKAAMDAIPRLNVSRLADTPAMRLAA